MAELNEKEQKALNLSVELWKALLDLEVIHPDDRKENSIDIHNIQNRICSRPYFKKNKQ